ncbi:flagellin C-terminal helical region [Rhizobium mongolense subsp. loessense]|uniref:Flagellin n=1 Tax=Rhizobium mongolense subsp. loessense TaxID=158890 RepID=A0A1G4SCR9_9HYPH|nr:flagellin [Rhizobium mongolense]SCW66930.1 flagellin C-terminal helical region [Rhizobium mongolense subsp. loessense]
MTSILTNTSATAALQTLRTASIQLTKTQNQASSGLRVEKAADNAAYWSIGTTMRSDVKALSAVSDAIQIGAAKTDTAYAATSSIIDVLSEFKAKLVAGKEPGVDKSKVQDELNQLSEQAESVAKSASFNGQNWLITDATTHLMKTPDLTAQVASAFVRFADGSISVEQSDVNLKNTSMLNAGGGGILQKEIGGLGDIGGFRNTNANSVAHQGHESHDFTGPTTFGATDSLEFDLILDAGAHTAGVTYTALRIDKSVVDAALGTTDGIIRRADDLRKVLNKIFADNSIGATADEWLFSGGPAPTSNVVEIASLESSGHPGSSINLANFVSNISGHPAGFAMGLESVKSNHDNMYPFASIDYTKPFTVSDTAEIYFDAQVGPGATQSFTINRSVVDAALGTTDGYVGNATDLAAVIQYVTSGIGLSVTASGSTITFAADQSVYPDAGNRAARVMVGNVHSSPRWTLDFDLSEVDVTASDFSVDDYITGIEYMLKRSTTSGSVLGSLSKRLEMQASFAESLQDSLKSGIGRLVDADMESVAAHSAALQTQQQLAIQSLSIANASPQNVLQLFQ